MKKMILAVTLLGLAGSQVQPAKAGDSEWAVVGKVLTGIAAVDIISHAISGPVVYQANYCAPAPAPVCYTPPPVVYRPAPVVYYRPPVYVRPAPVVVYSAPVVYRPAPVVTVRVSNGHGPRHVPPPFRGRW